MPNTNPNYQKPSKPGPGKRRGRVRVGTTTTIIGGTRATHWPAPDAARKQYAANRVASEAAHLAREKRKAREQQAELKRRAARTEAAARAEQAKLAEPLK